MSTGCGTSFFFSVFMGAYAFLTCFSEDFREAPLMPIQRPCCLIAPFVRSPRLCKCFLPLCFLTPAPFFAQ